MSKQIWVEGKEVEGPYELVQFVCGPGYMDSARTFCIFIKDGKYTQLECGPFQIWAEDPLASKQDHDEDNK